MGVNKVVLNSSEGGQTLIDLTGDSVTPSMLATGYTAHDASGEEIVGTLEVINKADITPVKGVDYFDGEKGDKGDKGDTGSTGATGERGTGVLNISIPPSNYTTTTGGFTPSYRMALSNIKATAKVENVLVGDTILHSYYTYPVGYVDSTYAYLGGSKSIRGASGAAGTTPVKGTDYYTNADKAEMVTLVQKALPTLTIEGVSEDGTLLTWTVFKYEGAAEPE